MQQQGSRMWSVDVDISEPGWLAVPRDLHGQALEAWVAEQKAELGRNWEQEWLPKPQAMVEEMLRTAARDRDPQDVIAFMVWPVKGQPIAVRVHIGFADSVDIAQVVAGANVEVLPVRSEALGPGLHLSEIAHVPEFGTAMAQSLLIFQDSDGAALVIAVEPTTVELLAAISRGLQDILDSMRAVDGQGRAFAATAPAGFIEDEDAEWQQWTSDRPSATDESDREHDER